MRHRDSNELELATDNWLSLIDVSAAIPHARQIDTHLNDTAMFWGALQIHCVAGCCGLSAFGFRQTDIVAAANASGYSDTRERLVRLHATISNDVNADCLWSETLNQYIDRGDLLRLLEHMIESLVIPSQRG